VPVAPSFYRVSRSKALKRHRAEQAERRLALGPAWVDLDLVSEKGDGSPIHPDVFSRWFSRQTARLGLPIRLHDLRHGFVRFDPVASNRSRHPERTVSLIEDLRTFNRKERFFVVGWALGNKSFTVDREFRRAVEARFGSMTIPSDAFCAMDFHLDWLSACLWLRKGEQRVYLAEDTGVIVLNQDVDLLLAWEQADVTHLLMIEAKGGASRTSTVSPIAGRPPNARSGASRVLSRASTTRGTFTSIRYTSAIPPRPSRDRISYVRPGECRSGIDSR
jgi:hypothetical protein